MSKQKKDDLTGLPPDHPDRLAQWDSESLRLQYLQEDLVDKAKDLMTESRRVHTLEARRLKELTAERRANRGKLVQGKLFDPPAPPPAGKGSGATFTPPADDNTWKEVPLASLSLPKALLAALANPIGKGPLSGGIVKPIKTLGDLEKFTASNDLQNLKGLGGAAITALDAAVNQFWGERVMEKTKTK